MSYEQYYTSSDVSVFLEHPRGEQPPVLLDKLSTIAWREQLSSQLMYGIGNSRYGFISTGNLSIMGQLSFNFTTQNYLFNSLNYLYKIRKIRVPDFEEIESLISEMSDAELLEYKRELIFGQVDNEVNTGSRGINQYPEGFNIRVVLNNGFMYNRDTDKVFVITGCKVVSSSLGSSSATDEPISHDFSFYAREIISEPTNRGSVITGTTNR